MAGLTGTETQLPAVSPAIVSQIEYLRGLGVSGNDIARRLHAMTLLNFARQGLPCPSAPLPPSTIPVAVPSGAGVVSVGGANARDPCTAKASPQLQASLDCAQAFKVETDATSNKRNTERGKAVPILENHAEAPGEEHKNNQQQADEPPAISSRQELDPLDSATALKAQSDSTSNNKNDEQEDAPAIPEDPGEIPGEEPDNNQHQAAELLTSSLRTEPVREVGVQFSARPVCRE